MDGNIFFWVGSNYSTARQKVYCNFMDLRAKGDGLYRYNKLVDHEMIAFKDRHVSEDMSWR